jgi:hypothetical protein
VAKSRSRHARQARGVARRGNTPPGSSEGGVPPSWGFYKGAGTLVEVGEAGFRAEPTREGGILEQDVDRPSGEPAPGRRANRVLVRHYRACEVDRAPFA